MSTTSSTPNSSTDANDCVCSTRPRSPRQSGQGRNSVFVGMREFLGRAGVKRQRTMDGLVQRDPVAQPQLRGSPARRSGRSARADARRPGCRVPRHRRTRPEDALATRRDAVGERADVDRLVGPDVVPRPGAPRTSNARSQTTRSLGYWYDRNGVPSPPTTIGPPASASRTKFPAAKSASSGRCGPRNAKSRPFTTSSLPAAVLTAPSISARRFASWYAFTEANGSGAAPIVFGDVRRRRVAGARKQHPNW